jgi:nicotinamide-nucleotide amidase
MRQTTLPDEEDLLISGLRECCQRATVVITTGGLGATLDDISARSARAIWSCEPKLLNNRVGSAPGLWWSKNDRHLIMLPGVPLEMQDMLEDAVIPILLKFLPPKNEVVHQTLHFSLLQESEIDPILRQFEEEGLKVGIYPSYGFVTVRLAGVDQKQVISAADLLRKRFHGSEFVSPSGLLEEAIHHWFVQNRQTLALAESCTGGALAAQLTTVPGASHFFLGSLVTYSNSWKETLLSVQSSTLAEKGAVSAETVAEMLAGIFSHTAADWGVAVSGIAGPSGGSEEKPVGIVWYAIGRRGSKPRIDFFDLSGRTRAAIISITTGRLLGLLWRMIQ